MTKHNIFVDVTLGLVNRLRKQTRHTRIGHRERPTPRAAFIANYISRKKVKVVCRICGSSFSRRNTFNQHMRRVHTNQGWISGQGFLLRDCDLLRRDRAAGSTKLRTSHRFGTWCCQRQPHLESEYLLTNLIDSLSSHS